VPAEWTDVGLLWSKLEEMVAQVKQEHRYEPRDLSDRSWVDDPVALQSLMHDRFIQDLSPSNYLARLWAEDRIEVRYRRKAIGSEQEAEHKVAAAGFSDRLQVRFTPVGELYHRSRPAGTAIQQILRRADGLERLVGYDAQVRLTRAPFDQARPTRRLTPADLAGLPTPERRIRLVYSVWAMKRFPRWSAKQAFQETRSLYENQFDELRMGVSRSLENNTWTEVQKRHSNS
jgi:hypothetical protein